MNDPLAELVDELTARFGRPGVRPHEDTGSDRIVQINSLPWVRTGAAAYKRVWIWLVDGHNVNVTHTLEGARDSISFSGPHHRVTYDIYGGTDRDDARRWPAPELVSALAHKAFGLDD